MSTRNKQWSREIFMRMDLPPSKGLRYMLIIKSKEI